ncbi:MAG: hypothetical protein AAB407_02880 [Patescibacteria group bacterium]
MQRTFIIALIALIIVVGLIVTFSKTEAPTENTAVLELAESFCGEPNIADVQVSRDVVRVVSTLTGGGSTFYYADGSELQCPTVAPEDISAECSVALKMSGWKSVCDALGTENVDARNTTYTIENELVTLVDGVSEIEFVPGSTDAMTTTVFGSPVFGDLDNDGDEDAGIYLIVQSGGTGSFYYAAAAIRNGAVWAGTNAVLLGDRIAPQTIEIKDGALVANYATRKVGEPFAVQPSVNVSKFMQVMNGKLAEVEQE